MARPHSRACSFRSHTLAGWIRRALIFSLLLTFPLISYGGSASAHQSTAVHSAASSYTSLQGLIVENALSIGSQLYGYPDTYYNANAIPADVLNYWSRFGANGQNGNLQCGVFAASVLAHSGAALPYIPANASDLWSAYAYTPGYQEIASGQGLPVPGDLIIWSDNGPGHVAIVTSVVWNGSGGTVTFEQANMYSPTETQYIDANQQIATWAGFTVLGYIQPF